MPADLCILLSTCERYRALAEFTRSRLENLWAAHPPIFVCGLDNIAAGLPLRDDPANWMKVTHSACVDLLARGFRKTYLILEDHPPFARCHTQHLNETLPRAMDSFGAICLALSGPGQHRTWHGKPARFGPYTFDHIAQSARWKFSLHPALWDLVELEKLLSWMIANFPVEEQNPWAFERKGGDTAAGIPTEWTHRSYRVVGSAMTARPFYELRRLPLTLLQFTVDVAAFFIRILRGAEARRKFDVATRGIFCPYDGPYPLFWSGIMRKGVLSEDLKLWLKITGRSRWLSEIPPVSPS